MNSLVRFILLICVVSAITCSEEGYAEYLKITNYDSKCIDGDCTTYIADHKDTFIAQCKKLQYKRLSGPTLHNETIIMDWTDDDLYELGDLVVKYSGVTAYNEPVDINTPEFFIEKEPSDFCEADFEQYSRPENPCSTSWATATVEAAEATLKTNGIYVKLSAKQLFMCVPAMNGDENGCKGAYPKAIASYLLEVGLVEKDKFTDCDAVDSMDTYRFVPSFPEPPNASGLMNKIAEDKDKLVFTMLAIDLPKLRFTRDMSEIDEPRACGWYDPSLYAVITGYKYVEEMIEDSFWEITTHITPCEEVIVRIPMSANDTNANYAGIAAYAFSLDLLGEYATTEPTTEPPTVEPTEEPTAEPTEEPTTEPPTTEPPTTEPPTTEPPTTEPPTTEPPTTEAPTTPVPSAGPLEITSEQDCEKIKDIYWESITVNTSACADADPIVIDSYPYLESISFGADAFMFASSLSITNNEMLTSVTFGSHSFLAASITISGNNALTSIRFESDSALTSKNLNIHTLPALKTLTFEGKNFMQMEQFILSDLEALETLTFAASAVAESTSVTLSNFEKLTTLTLGSDVMKKVKSLTLESMHGH